MGHAVCCALEDCTDAHDCCPDQDGLLSAKIVAKYESSDGTEEAADVVDGL